MQGNDTFSILLSFRHFFIKNRYGPQRRKITRTDDSCIFTNSGRHLKIIRQDEEYYYCNPIETEQYSTSNLGVDLDWAKCGVFRNMGVVQDQGFYDIVPKGDVGGKVVLSQRFAIEMMPHWLVRY